MIFIVKIWKTALVYAFLGLTFGVYYREIGKFFDYDGETVLVNLHVHTLVLGTMMSLLILSLEKSYSLTHQKSFWTIWIWYHVGVLSLLGMTFIRGTIEVLQTPLSSGLDASITGIAGIAHILLAVGLIRLLLVIGKSIKA